jgi:Fe-Mn family superoxide dismutase
MMMPHSVAPLCIEPPCLDGLSEQLLASHYENNYGGALPRLNAIDERLGEIGWLAASVFEINGLKRWAERLRGPDI